MLLTTISIFLLYNSVNLRRDRTILFSRITMQILLFSALIAYNNLNINLLERGLSLFGGLFQLNVICYYFQIFILILSFLIVGLTSFYPRKILINDYSSLNKLLFFIIIYKYKTVILNKMGEQFRIMEYSLVLLFIITGALFLISTSDMVSLFLSIELQSYGLYLISTLYRNSESSTAGGLTYFLLGGLSSCFILLSTALLYANTGTTNLENLYIINNICSHNEVLNNIYWYKPYYMHLSLLVMAVGLLFKISAAPFHFWSPDVYDGIPTLVTTFVAIIAKISIFIFLLQLLYYTNKSLFNFNWTTALLLSSFLSLIIGSVLGLTQSRIKKLYAYSTISHVGFILLALSIQSVESIQAFIFYLIQYSISNLNAFIILIAIGYSLFYYTNKDKHDNLKETNNSPMQYISQLKGYYYINPILSISFSITLFSFIGIPPLVGFFAKQMVLLSAIDNGYIFMCLTAILTSVISAVYYLIIIKQIFFNISDNNINMSLKLFIFKAVLYNKRKKEKQIINFKYNNIVLSSYLSIIISILTLSLIMFIFINKFCIDMINILTFSIFYC